MYSVWYRVYSWLGFHWGSTSILEIWFKCSGILLKDAKPKETMTYSQLHTCLGFYHNVMLGPLTEQETNKPHLCKLKMEYSHISLIYLFICLFLKGVIWIYYTFSNNYECFCTSVLFLTHSQSVMMLTCMNK